MSRWRVILNHWGWWSVGFFALIFAVSLFYEIVYDNYTYTYGSVEADGRAVERERESRYYLSHDKVYWRHNSIGSPYVEMPEVDPDSFTVYSAEVAADKNFVYFDTKVQKAVDRVSFQELSEGFYKDRNYLFQAYGDELRPIEKDENIDLASLVALPFGWFIDKNSVYRLGAATNQLNEFDLDPDSFVILDNYYQKDVAGIYYNGQKVKDVDPASFVVFARTKAAKDSRSIIIGGKIVESMDYDSFMVEQTDDGNYTSKGKDINGEYNLMKY